MTSIPVEILQGGEMYCSSIDCLVLTGHNIYYPLIFILVVLTLGSYIFRRLYHAKGNSYRFN